MKKISKLTQYALASLMLLSACDFETETEFIKKPVEIDLQIAEHTLAGTKVYIEATPSQDEVYYVWDVSPCERIDNFNRSEKAYMDLVIDGLYAQYINWRHGLLEAGEPFVGSFANHSLSYAKTNYFFTDLKPETDYYVWGFCVNAENNKPMGPLYKKKFRTKSLPSPDFRSSMTFEFEVNGKNVLVVPSEEDVDDYFVWSAISVRELIAEFGGDTEKWVLADYQNMMATGMMRKAMCRGLTKFEYEFDPGETYVVAATAYELNFEKTLFYRVFTYDGSWNFTVERGVDDIDAVISACEKFQW